MKGRITSAEESIPDLGQPEGADVTKICLLVRNNGNWLITIDVIGIEIFDSTWPSLIEARPRLCSRNQMIRKV